MEVSEDEVHKYGLIAGQTISDDLIQPPPENPRFNYLVDIFTKWHGSFFYFCATYHCPSPNAISPSFERKFARMTYSGNNTYTLSYMRHTDK